MSFDRPHQIFPRHRHEAVRQEQRLSAHLLLFVIPFFMLAVEALQKLEDAGVAPNTFDRWEVVKRFAFFDIVFEDAISEGSVSLHLFSSMVTYAFLHNSWPHVTLNMAALLALGHVITTAIGIQRLLATFAITASAGAISFGLLTDIPNPVVGASGVVFGFLGMVTAWQERALAMRSASRMRIWQRIVGIAAINAALAILIGSLFAWQTHLGGFVAGWLLALVWRADAPGSWLEPETTDARLPDQLPDNWRRIILDHHHRPNFCPRALWADLRDTPPVDDRPSQRHGAER